MTNILDYDALVLGAGAAGLMCAQQTGQSGRRVAVLDHAERAGKKILISGGGRANFTNLHCKAENFISANPHFAKSALAGFGPRDFLAQVERSGIRWHEKKLGQLFCDHSAQQIVDLLLSLCAEAGVTVHLRTEVQSVRHNAGFEVLTHTSQGEIVFRAPALVVATGGLSIPKMGATGLGYEIARQFGLRVVEPRPALVPLVLAQPDQRDWCALSGVSAEVAVTTELVAAEAKSLSAKKKPQACFNEKMLVTHRGLSGPAILQISSYWCPGQPIRVDFAPRAGLTARLVAEPQRDVSKLRAALREYLPQRLADRMLTLSPPEGWSNRALAAWEDQLHGWSLTPVGTEGYEKAEVTAGGVDTAELSAKSMESTRVPGLFFVGEVVDVTGQLGGFNFQWAWSSAVAAGRALGRR